MRHLILYVAFATTTSLSCAQSHESVAKPGFYLDKSGFIECSSNKKHSCELSAALCLTSQLKGEDTMPLVMVASDKPLESIESDSIIIGRMNTNNFNSLGVIKNPSNPVKKIETLTKSIDGHFIFAITAFDREESGYSEVIYWEFDKLHNAGTKVFFLDKDENKIDFRRLLLDTYKKQFNSDIGFIKIEGGTFLSDKKLLLGVRQIGVSYKEPKDVFHIISVELNNKNGVPFIKSDSIKFEADFTKKVNSFFGKDFGLSDLYINHISSKNIWALVTHESGKEGTKQLEGRLLQLILPENGLLSDSRILVAENQQNAPLMLIGKPEGICEYRSDHFFIVYDDDKELTRTGTPTQRSYLSQARYEIFIRKDRIPRIFKLN